VNAGPPRETALVVLVPEAEALVAPWRQLHDPSCAAGVPAHITLLYPFRTPERLDAALHRELADLFGQTSAFDFSLTQLATFPGVLFLAPEPAAPFIALIRALMARFPDTPPYGGAYAQIVPHLTVAQSDDSATLETVAAALAGFAPIMARAREATLLAQGEDGLWQALDRYAMREGSTSTNGAGEH
jgi:2'-5' RNA ligase